MTSTSIDEKTDKDQWVELICQQHHHLDRQKINDAYQYAVHLSETATSPYTTSTLEQGIKMADLLLDIGCDNATAIAALTYSSIYYAQPNRDKVTQKLTSNVSKLIYGATRMEAIHNMHRNEEALNPQQIDNLRKMLLAIVDDVRIVLIKLAERLITLQYLKKCNEEQQQYIANQVINFYAPLANRLGIGQLKWQLEDLAFRYLNSQKYFEISKALNMRRSERETFIQEIMAELTKLLNDHEIQDYSLSGRAKHIYSIYKKAQRKQLPVSEIFDASAIRVLVNNMNDCYKTLSLTHERWEHIEKEFDDYVSNPKPNGYQSIHTAIIANPKHNVEIQIRTYDMHAAAELGVAAHWKYKEGSEAQESYESKIERLRELINWQQEVTEEDTNIYESLFSDRIYAFTPQGDVFDLPAGATPLDFAYHIHTSIGHRTKGAKVNDKIVPLTHALETGDRVEIITSKNEQPSRDWMNKSTGYLKSSTAVAKVRHWFKKQNYDKDLAAGLAIFEKAARHDNINKSDLKKAIKRFNVKEADDLLVAIGSGNVGIASVLHYIKSLDTTQPATQPIEPIARPSKEKSSPLVIEGVGKLLTNIARCCKPIPGDSIIGYITNGRGVTIHTNNCPNIQHEILTRPQRIIDVAWGDQNSGSYLIDLKIVASDRSGLIRDISAVIAQEKLPFLGLSTHVNNSTNEAVINITFELDGNVSIDYIRNQLLQIEDVIKVERS